MRILLFDKSDDLIDEIIEGEQDDFAVDFTSSIEDGGYLASINDYDTVVIGPGAEIKSEREFFMNLRASHMLVPVVVAAQEEDISTRIRMLDAGADVCVNYPIKPDEFRAQLRALSRRKRCNFDVALTLGKLIVKVDKKKICLGEKEIVLRKKDFEILLYLINNKGRVVSVDQVLDVVWGESSYIFTNIVEAHISQLRKTLRNFGIDGLISTRKGFGYIIEG